MPWGVALDIITCPPPSEREAFSQTFSTSQHPYNKENLQQKNPPKGGFLIKNNYTFIYQSTIYYQSTASVS
jgi:hypothetical protein